MPEIRPASTVIVLRDTPVGPEVFMVRRHRAELNAGRRTLQDVILSDTRFFITRVPPQQTRCMTTAAFETRFVLTNGRWVPETYR